MRSSLQGLTLRWHCGSENVSKKGYLHYPESKDDVWVKRWFVIRRPYMYIYASNSEMEELTVVNLTHIRVDYKRDLEEMLEVKQRMSLNESKKKGNKRGFNNTLSCMFDV